MLFEILIDITYILCHPSVEPEIPQITVALGGLSGEVEDLASEVQRLIGADPERLACVASMSSVLDLTDDSFHVDTMPQCLRVAWRDD